VLAEDRIKLIEDLRANLGEFVVPGLVGIVHEILFAGRFVDELGDPGPDLIPNKGIGGGFFRKGHG
jgi:hypothetical protein